jgi:hypothetical protein
MCLMDSVSIVPIGKLSKNHYMGYIMDILHIYYRCLLLINNNQVHMLRKL